MRTLSSLLCQPAPDTAETTKLGTMRTQACIPQFLHTNETSENLSNALHALFIHCLRLGGVHGDPRSPRSDLLGAGPRSPGQVAAENSPAPTSGSSNDRPICAPHCFGFGAGYPHFAIFIRAPALGRSGRASGGRSSFHPVYPPASDREAALAHVSRAGARVWNRS